MGKGGAQGWNQSPESAANHCLSFIYLGWDELDLQRDHKSEKMKMLGTGMDFHIYRIPRGHSLSLSGAQKFIAEGTIRTWPKIQR